MYSDYQKPLYIQLKNNIKNKILSGEYEVGSYIPSERFMSEYYGINRMTVRKSIKALVDEGLLENVHGKGNRVVANRGKIRLGSRSFGSLRAGALDAGLTPKREILAFEIVDKSACEQYKDEMEEKLVRIKRIMYLDGQPYAVQDSYLPFSIYGDALEHDFVKESLLDYRNSRIVNSYCVSELNVIEAGEEMGEILQVDEKYSIFTISYLSRAYGTHKMIEYTMGWHLREHSTFSYEMKY